MKCQMCDVVVTQNEANESDHIVHSDLTLCPTCARAEAADRLQEIAVTAGCSVADADRIIRYGWTNQAEHRTWLFAASTEEIGAWVAAIRRDEVAQAADA